MTLLPLASLFTFVLASFVSASTDIDDLQIIPSPEETARKLVQFFLDDDGPKLSRSKRQLSSFFDVAYVIDSSSSISDLEFSRGVRAVQQMISKSKSASKHAVVTIATRGKIVLNFTAQSRAVTKLRSLKRSGGKTNTQEALDLCYQMFVRPEFSARDESFKRVLIITDGQSNIKRHLTIQKATKLKYVGVEVFVIAVGEYLDGMEELSKLASSPNVHMYRVEDMRGLVLVVKLIPRSLNQWRNNLFGGRPGGELDGGGILRET